MLTVTPEKPEKPYYQEYLLKSELNESDVNYIFSMITEENEKYFLCREPNSIYDKSYIAELNNLKTELYNFYNGKSSDISEFMVSIFRIGMCENVNNRYNFFNKLNCLFKERCKELNERQEQ